MGADVTIVEAELAGRATAAGAGIIQPWSTSVTGAFYDLYAASAAYYGTLIEQLAEDGVSDIDYRVTGGLVVSPDDDAINLVQQRVEARAADIGAAGIGTVSRVNNTEARQLFPPLAEELHGIHISGGARVDGRSLRDGLVKAAQAHGATIVVGRAQLEGDGQSVPRLSVGSEVVAADAIVVAAGVWTNALLEQLGQRIGLNPQRGQITHLRVDGVDTQGWPSVHPMSGHYLVAFDDSRVVVGATRESGSGFDARVTAAGQKEVLDAALATAPGLADATLIETRVGLRPVADDDLPYIGALDGVSGLFVNAGFGAAGLTMGPYAGQLLAELVLTGKVGALASFAPNHPDHLLMG